MVEPCLRKPAVVRSHISFRPVNVAIRPDMRIYTKTIWDKIDLSDSGAPNISRAVFISQFSPNPIRKMTLHASAIAKACTTMLAYRRIAAMVDGYRMELPEVH